jgi:hypothetical protein
MEGGHPIRRGDGLRRLALSRRNFSKYLLEARRGENENGREGVASGIRYSYAGALRDIDRAAGAGLIFPPGQLDLRLAAKHYQDLVFPQVPMHPNHITGGQV